MEAKAKSLLLMWVSVTAAGLSGAGAQVAPAPTRADAVADASAQPRQRSREVRLAVEAQRAGLAPDSVGKRRLSEQERAQLRQLLRQHDHLHREAEGKR